MNDFNNEIWKTIEDYEDYEVSNYGRVKSLNYRKSKQEQILKQGTNKYGYQVVALYKDGKQKMFLVHRLVAMSFISNPNNYEQVNHKDEVKTNNNVDNLEWCNCKYNINYGSWIEKHSKLFSGENNPMYGKFGKEHHSSKQIIQLTLSGEVVRNWDSAIDIKHELGFDNSNISKCCKGRYKSSYGYKWQYA